MKKFIKNMRVWSLLDALFCIVFGVLLLTFQDFTKLAIIYTFASLIMVMGFVKIFNYFGYGIDPFGFVTGLVNIAISIVVFANAEWILNLNIFSFFFGIIFLVKSLFSVGWSLDCLKLGAKFWWLDLIFSLLAFCLGILILVNPASEQILFVLIGVTLIINGISSLIDTIIVSSKVKKVKKSIKSLFSDDKIYLDENEYDTK